MRHVGVMKRWVLTALGGLSFACSFDAPSSGPNSDIEETDTGDMSTGDDPPLPGSTSGSAGGSGDTGSTGLETGESTGVQGETTSAPPKTADPRADLVFTAPSPIDLGAHPLNGTDILTLELSNDGDAAASILGGEPPPPPLVWAGGTFPGSDGTCGGLVPPGATCTVSLAVGPGNPGLITGPVEVRFDDETGVGTALAYVDAVGTGFGPNLIVNPDAESDPPGPILTGWSTGGSSFRTDDEHSHNGGQLSFYGGSSASPDLSQDISLSAMATSIDELGLSFAFQGWSRANHDYLALESDDPHDIRVFFLDGEGEALAVHGRTDIEDDSWTSTSFDQPIPTGTRRVRVQLSCDREHGSSCSAWFDDFSGRLRYEP